MASVFINYVSDIVGWALGSSKKPPARNVQCTHRSGNPTTTAMEGECAECAAERIQARRYRWRIIAGLFLPFALQSLDVTIIATALTTIALEFGELRQQNWIVAAFNLTSSAFIPFWGSMCDIFGRHAPLQVCLLLAMVGSAICTAAPTTAFPALAVGRALQGVAGAGIDVCIRVILADKVSLRESSNNWTIFSFIGGIAFGLGPVIGGYLTKANWRWCFGINLPIGAAGILSVLLLLRKELLGPQPIPLLDSSDSGSPSAPPARTAAGKRARFINRLRTVDYWGQLSFLLGFGLLILGLTWAGPIYPWDSAAVLVPLVVGAAICAAWAYWEFLMDSDRALGMRWPWKSAMVQWRVIADRNVALIGFSSFTTGMGMFAVFYFCGIYFVLVAGMDPAKAGTSLIYFTPGIAGGIYLASLATTSWPRHTYHPIVLGAVLQAVGMGVLAWALYAERQPVIFGMMALIGAGTGLKFVCVPLHGIGMFPNHIATVISIVAVLDPLGGTIGHTIMSTVFNNVVNFGSADDFLSDLDSLKNLPEEQLAELVQSVKMGVVWAYVSLVPFMVLTIFATGMLGTVNLPEDAGSEEDRRANVVIREPYLWALLYGRANKRAEEAIEGSEMDVLVNKNGHAPPSPERA